MKQSQVLIALLCYTTTAYALNVHSLNKSWSLPPDSKEYLVPGTLFFTDDNSFPFAICGAKDQESSKVERLCNVTLVTPEQKDRKCSNVRVFANQGRQFFLNGYIQLWPFSQDHVIIVWWDETNTNDTTKKEFNYKVGILNMNRCTTAYLDFPINKVAYGFFPAMLLYSNEVDVILNSKQKCNNTDICRVAYDLNGKQIGGVQPYHQNISGYASPVSARVPRRGFFMAVQDLKTLTVLLIDSNGSGKKILTDVFENGVTKQRVAFSNAHELYSICRLPVVPNKKPTEIHCAQFNSRGKLLFNKTVSIPETVGWLTVRNLPLGGFILATAACDNSQSPNNENCKGFNIYRVLKNRPQNKPLTIKNFDLKCSEAPESKPDHTELGVHVYENRRRDFCFDFSCLHSNTLNFTSTCVARRDIQSL